MNIHLKKIKELWESEDIALSTPITNKEILLFQQKNNLLIPKDLVEYFIWLNGTSEEYDQRLFQLYSFKQFKGIDEELKDWDGIPDYRGIVNTLNGYENCFVFADYSFHMFSYAIRLYQHASEKNEVYIICGNEYKVIANSFTEFIDLYLDESIELQFT